MFKRIASISIVICMFLCMTIPNLYGNQLDYKVSMFNNVEEEQNENIISDENFTEVFDDNSCIDKNELIENDQNVEICSDNNTDIEHQSETTEYETIANETEITDLVEQENVNDDTVENDIIASKSSIDNNDYSEIVNDLQVEESYNHTDVLISTSSEINNVCDNFEKSDDNISTVSEIHEKFQKSTKSEVLYGDNGIRTYISEGWLEKNPYGIVKSEIKKG